MKRREFITSTAGLAGAIVTGAARAVSQPCPPPSLSISGGASATTVCASAAADVTGVPGWFAAMSDRTWSMPVSNTLDAVKPIPLPPGDHATICTAWTGGCVDQSRGEFILAANGGHGDYGGNEVYSCEVRSDSPAWKRLTEPSQAAGGTDAKNSSMGYADGRPRPVHGWHRCCFGADRVWYAGIDGAFYSGMWSTACYSFSRSSLAWAYHGIAIADIGGGNFNGEAGVAAYDRVRNMVWSLGGAGATGAGYNAYTIDCSTGAITPRSLPNSASGRWTAIAPDLDLWIVGDPFSNYLTVLDLKNPAAGFRRVAYTGTFPVLGSGCVYHKASRALLLWHDSGASIQKVSIPENVWTGTWTVSTVAAAPGNSVIPTRAPVQGTFSRFNIIEDMGNGQSALCLVNGTRESVFVYKLPVSGV